MTRVEIRTAWQARHMASPSSPDSDAPSEITIGAGQARIDPDKYSPGSFTLIVDERRSRTSTSRIPPTSSSNTSAASVTPSTTLPDGPTTALHLGGGALTLPRYVEAMRPGSRQQVIELEQDLIDLVRAELPFPRGASIRVRYGDARAVMEKLPAGLRGTVDLLVVDVFGGSRDPRPRHLARVLHSGCGFSVSAWDPRGQFGRRSRPRVRARPGVAARDGVEHVAAVPIPAAQGRRIEHRSHGSQPTAAGRDAAGVLGGSAAGEGRGRGELRDFIAGAPVVTDATAVPSPEPSRSVFGGR